jgi:hypothetical protein
VVSTTALAPSKSRIGSFYSLGIRTPTKREISKICPIFKGNIKAAPFKSD